MSNSGTPIHPKLVVGAGGTLLGTAAMTLSVLGSKVNGQAQTALALLVAIIGVAITVLVLVIGYFTPSGESGVSPAQALEGAAEKRFASLEADVAKIPGLAAEMPTIKAAVAKVESIANGAIGLAGRHEPQLAAVEKGLEEVRSRLGGVAADLPKAEVSLGAPLPQPGTPVPPAQPQP